MVDIYLLISSKTPGRTKKARYKYILVYNGRSLEGEGEVRDTTGHRLVLTCAIEAMKRMTRPCEITIHTDCRYLINHYGCMREWRANGWKRAGGELKNADLWQQLYKEQLGHAVKCIYEKMDLFS